MQFLIKFTYDATSLYSFISGAVFNDLYTMQYLYKLS